MKDGTSAVGVVGVNFLETFVFITQSHKNVC